MPNCLKSLHKIFLRGTWQAFFASLRAFLFVGRILRKFREYVIAKQRKYAAKNHSAQCPYIGANKAA